MVTGQLRGLPHFDKYIFSPKQLLSQYNQSYRLGQLYQYFCVRLLNINYLFVTNSPPKVYFFFLAMKCELCEREMERLTVHHLVPRQAVKRKKAAAGPTANICSPCHDISRENGNRDVLTRG